MPTYNYAYLLASAVMMADSGLAAVNSVCSETGMLRYLQRSSNLVATEAGIGIHKIKSCDNHLTVT